MVTGFALKSPLLNMLLLLCTICLDFSIQSNYQWCKKSKLFAKLKGSILNFGSEIWGMHEASDIELIHTKFLRRILGVKKSTNLIALYGELRWFPLHIIRKVHMIKYWIKLLKEPDTSLIKQFYLMLKEDTDHNYNYNGKTWASQIKQLLQRA